MKLHITPSFNIDRLCKTASVLLFLVNIHVSAQYKHRMHNVSHELVIVTPIHGDDLFLFPQRFIIDTHEPNQSNVAFSTESLSQALMAIKTVHFSTHNASFMMFNAFS